MIHNESNRTMQTNANDTGDGRQRQIENIRPTEAGFTLYGRSASVKGRAASSTSSGMPSTIGNASRALLLISSKRSAR